MLKRYTVCLLLALAATQVPPATPFRGETGVIRARAATQWASGATGENQAGHEAHSSVFSSTGDDYTTHSLTAQEEILLNLLNRDRISAGLPPLAHDPALSAIARAKSRDMQRNGYFAHESPTWGKARAMLTAFGYPFRACGENIARHATVDKAQAAFMSSEGHRRNILSPNWEKVGIGVVVDAQGFVYATQLFVR